MATLADPEVDDGLAFCKQIYTWTAERQQKKLCNQLSMHPDREAWVEEYKYWADISLAPSFKDVDYLCKTPILPGDLCFTPEQRNTLVTLKKGIINDIVAQLKTITEQEQYPPSEQQITTLWKLGQEWDGQDCFVILLLYVVSRLIQHSRQVQC
jgi:hypothetical protein